MSKIVLSGAGNLGKPERDYLNARGYDPTEWELSEGLIRPKCTYPDFATAASISASPYVSYRFAFGTSPTSASIKWVDSLAPAEPYVPPPAIDPKKLEMLKLAEPRKVQAKCPDYIEPVTSWRAWAVTSGKLAGIGRDVSWEPKKPMVAACDEDCEHEAPDKDCGCGLWSFKTLEELITALAGYQNIAAIGQASIWGRVIDCEHGYRSQFAYPKELWLMEDSMEQLGYVYNVPIRTMSQNPPQQKTSSEK